MGDENKTDHHVWSDAKSTLESHFSHCRSERLIAIPDASLAALPRMCCWPSGLPRTFDQFRRRFECSCERAVLWNKFLSEEQTVGATGSEESRRGWLSRTDSYVRVLCELLWIVYSAVNESVAIYLDDSDSNGQGAQRTTCLKCSAMHPQRMELHIDTAIFVPKDLQVLVDSNQIFRPNERPTVSGWSALDADRL